MHMSVGGMHSVALTRDNKILTWGVNDQGALGRPTPNEGKMVDLPVGGNDDSDSDSDSDDDDSGLNPSEAEPRQVDPSHFPEGTVFVSVHAGDSTTFALTNTGLVYGWGTFRVSSTPSSFPSSANNRREMTVSLVSAMVSTLKPPLSSSPNSRRSHILPLAPTTF